ncbi:uncharacterized protein A4U43_C07F11630 [Asparagus officinalis]|uniref:C3H1-type domain-containing protein n=1 Tax=Asparagus officinalis TaxID=4686 RepID=A0A5P1EEH0_ASPOF|nr:zinc finger CCCH domain-containing protein 3 isoform X2 [Asparagus officinalis]ONK63121.1 uncharacterized protein A4U43_C07F11630 [Asparagus officinalis]
MPLGKYYCDYCDKQFQDTHFARKRHLSGSQHQRARAQWYDSFKGPHGGPLQLGVCHHFVRTGNCKYGDSCKYFHPVQTAVNTTPTLSGPGSLGANPFVGVGSVSGDQTGVSWGNLPPSLRPPPEGGYPPLPFLDWG